MAKARPFRYPYQGYVLCPMCGKWFGTKCTIRGYTASKHCKNCRKIAPKLANRSKADNLRSTVKIIEVNFCTLFQTSIPQRCLPWMAGKCSEENYLKCLSVTADLHWAGWRTRDGRKMEVVMDKVSYRLCSFWKNRQLGR